LCHPSIMRSFTNQSFCFFLAWLSSTAGV
jgi:hypothetical protein